MITFIIIAGMYININNITHIYPHNRECIIEFVGDYNKDARIADENCKATFAAIDVTAKSK